MHFLKLIVCVTFSMWSLTLLAKNLRLSNYGTHLWNFLEFYGNHIGKHLEHHIIHLKTVLSIVMDSLVILYIVSWYFLVFITLSLYAWSSWFIYQHFFSGIHGTRADHIHQDHRVQLAPTTVLTIFVVRWHSKYHFSFWIRIHCIVVHLCVLIRFYFTS